MCIRCGKPYPLGATFDGRGVNFSLFSSVAQRVELCLFDDRGEETRQELIDVTDSCWHAYIPGLRAGQRYGFRVYGPWAPEFGLRCNPSKLLLDPYARCIDGIVKWHEAVYDHHFADPRSRNDLDSAPYVQRSVVVAQDFDWGNDKPLRTPWSATVIYEAHVKGLTKRRCDIPPELRGTYLGLAHPNVIQHLKSLGVTAIELMPVHHFVHDQHLLERGLRNYWGYNSIGFFAPHAEYAVTPGGQVREFKQMVQALHEGGLEVILDVVYCHTAEGNHLGPVLCLKGIDNPVYYRLVEDDRFHYIDHTGTGNSLNTSHPRALQLVVDSLRYWVTEMHVDGFRFDLAAALARGSNGVDRLSAFFEVIRQDRVVRQVKVIAEPWDVGEGGYQVGNFPRQWSEWNGRFRDCVRDFWRGVDNTLCEFADRMAGSPDLYEPTRRRPTASINFVTAHDGFTLSDLVSYNDKHNDTNGDLNLDGENYNRSWNCGIEGPTEDRQVNELRAQQKRNLITTTLLAQGVPMFVAGDEVGRTQNGNNNAYCQDNETSWVDWEQADYDFCAFVSAVLTLRREHAVFRQLRFLDSCAYWYRHDGRLMTPEDWNTGYAKSLGMLLRGTTQSGRVDEFYVAFNAHHEPLQFTLPQDLQGDWTVVLDTGQTRMGRRSLEGVTFSVAARSLLVLHGHNASD